MPGIDGSTFIKWQVEDDFLPRKSRNHKIQLPTHVWLLRSLSRNAASLS